jgi:hypothetical protein
MKKILIIVGFLLVGTAVFANNHLPISPELSLVLGVDSDGLDNLLEEPDQCRACGACKGIIVCVTGPCAGIYDLLWLTLCIVSDDCCYTNGGGGGGDTGGGG